MKYEIYDQLEIADDFSIIDFISEGKNGRIPKRIEFTLTDVPGIVNLAFGDIDANGEINDYSISNNGDRNKILSTVAFANYGSNLTFMLNSLAVLFPFKGILRLLDY
ncbi:MAG TPA: hypothetical protein VFE32_06660 [Puia sp.]|jgi:hypothetical protein|nr:hypothetical protein [Puia sp.]